MRGLSSFVLIVAMGCTEGVHPTYTATFSDRAIRIESYARAFRNAEPSLVAGLESETRLLARITPRPTPGQLSEDKLPWGAGTWLSRGVVDPFMFTDREAMLAREQDGFERVALTADAALQAEVLGARAEGKRAPEEPLLKQVKLEQAAFRRLLDAEIARLEKERMLPRGAADLVRTLSLAWPLSPKPGELHDLESMLDFRFTNLEESLAPNTLSAAEREDLRVALAELAPKVAGMPHAAKQMVKLRTALDGMWVTPYALEDERDMDRDLTAYVGSPLAFDALDASLESAGRAFEVQVTAGLSVLDGATAAAVRAQAKALLFGAPRCLPRVPVSSPLDLAPPEERTWSCALLHAFDDAKTDTDELAVDLAWHDAIVVARWAVSTHGPVRAIDAAERRAQLLLALSREERDRLMLLARARPMNAIAAGVAATVVMKHGAARARARAHRWRGIGDAPMDLIDEQMD
jgi:hypothetical protein